MAMRARRPDIPALPLFVGVGLLDILDGAFIVAGWDRVTANLSSGPYLFFDLTFIDWDHSLLAALVWAFVWAALFWRRKHVAVAAAAAVFSHFVADWPVHNGDLALYPFAARHLGLGLWSRLGTASWVLEGAFALALCTYAWVAEIRRGAKMIWPSIVLAVLFVSMSPWLSPMKLVAALSEPGAHLAHGALVTFGFLAPGMLLAWLVERAAGAGGRGRDVARA
jgi:hypothetical protein